MLVDYRRYLNTINYEALLVEACDIWCIEAPEQYDQAELIEILVGKDDNVNAGGGAR